MKSLHPIKKIIKKKDSFSDKQEMLNSIILDSLNESEREKEHILNSLMEKILYLNPDFTVKWMNDAAINALSADLSTGDIIGELCYKLRHNRTSPCINCPAMTTIKSGWYWKEEIEYPSGLTSLISAQPDYDDEDILKGIVVVELDITMRRDFEKALAKSKQRSGFLLNAIPDVLLIFNSKGIFIDYHPAADFDLINPEVSPEGKHLSETMEKRFAETILKKSEKLISPGASRNFEYAAGSKKKAIYYDCRLIKIDNNETACVIRDITQQRSKEKAIFFKSFHDGLTGLYNRAYFEEEINRLEKSRSVLPVSILMIDVNSLKFTNDAFGHEYGDALLKKISEIISDNCRKSDVIARTGGDEFAIILPRSPIKEAENLSWRIIKACAESSYEDIFARPSVSIGCASKTDESTELRDVIKTADEKMYKMKLDKRSEHLNTLISDILLTMKKRSDESESHLKRCTELAENFCRKLNLSASTAEKIKKLARLHDIGKIRIPQSILSGKTPLSEKELEMIKQHTVIGYRIAKAISDYSSAAELILYHHENWDGSGYPSGLNEKEIPLGSRIFKLIDKFDELTHDRPYRQSISREEAVDYILQESGRQFDPELAETFIKVLNEEKIANEI